MGLAASQARLLLLTARKSDLEYRAQCITNTEMILAMQTESIAREYSQKISNQALFFTNAFDPKNQTIALHSGNLRNITGGAYKLQMNLGNGQWVDWQEAQNEITYRVDEAITAKDENGNEVTYAVGDPLSAEQYANLSGDDKAKCTQIVADYTNDFDDLALLNALNAGTMRLVSATETDENGEPLAISISANTGFTESYYTDDDAEAEAEYKRKTASIQVKEKRLQMDLQQVEAQQKACETEIESVKKVMDKNIEKTFKVFS